MNAEQQQQIKEARPRAIALARYVWKQVQRTCGRSIGCEDLEQVATWELFAALERWRASYGTTLWQFARRGVLGALLRVVRKARRGGRLPYHPSEEEQVLVPTPEDRMDARRAWEEQLLSDDTLAQTAERLGYGATSPRTWSAAELAAELQISRRRVTRLLETGAIQGEKQKRSRGGQEWVIPDHAAVDALRARR